MAVQFLPFNFYCRNKMNDCASIACSEIRAATLSGDCDLKLELMRGNFFYSLQVYFFYIEDFF